MRVTVIDGDVSYPPSSGKRIRTLHLLLGLAKEFRITYIARSDERDQRAAETFFRDHNIRPILVHAPLPKKTGAALYGRLAANLIDREPYSVRLHRHQVVRQAVQSHAASTAPNLWQLEWMGYDYCLDQHQGPMVLQAHNVDSVIWQRYLDVETNFLKRVFIGSQRDRMRQLERRVFQRAIRIVAVSTPDAEIARSLYGELPLEVVDNGVDPEYFRISKRAEGLRTVLFLGALDWRPNVDALSILVRDIWPRVLRTITDAHLLIVGRRPSRDLVARLAEVPHCKLRADVDDVRPFLGKAAVLALPLRIGGGSRVKILEALAAELPVVSTAVGAEGLGIKSGHHFTRAETADEFAAALKDVLARPAHHRALAAQGREYVTQHHDWTSLSSKLGSIWLDSYRSHHQGRRNHDPPPPSKQGWSWRMATFRDSTRLGFRSQL
jgi:glycosyltransferase involved in cell wall biosynthesis